jgi:hypothetical protein
LWLPYTSKYTVDLFATIKNDGRILDDVRCILGETDVVEATFKRWMICSRIPRSRRRL